MHTLTREALYSLEDYAEARPAFRAKVMAHKRSRQVPLGPNVTLYFEDRLTMQYQVQEMLRAERIFGADGIDEELAAYNPLIPGGTNWKATFMIEFPEVEARQEALAHMLGIEDRVWVQVEGFDPIWAIADEDLERDTDEKTSAVHFLRFELSREMVKAVRSGAGVSAGIDHPAYRHTVAALPGNVRDSLAGDLH